MKEEDVRKAISVLENAGFHVSDCSQVRSCFDLLARKDDDLLLIKPSLEARRILFQERLSLSGTT